MPAYRCPLSGQFLPTFPAVALGPVDIKEKVSGFRTWIQTPPAEVRGLRLAKSKGPVSQANKTGEELYNDLIAPLAKHIETRNLTIVPHGALHYLPFNALSNGNTYLIDRYRVRVLPSASVMAFLKNNKQEYQGRLLAFGNPDLNNPALDLPGAEAESRAITRKVPKASLYTRKQATETVAKADGSRYKYVHFALHGTFDAEKPLSSGLLLAPDTQNDGILTVGELYTMNIPADLPVKPPSAKSPTEMTWWDSPEGSSMPEPSPLFPPSGRWTTRPHQN